MTELRRYLLRIVCSAAILSLLTALLSNDRLKRVLRLCGGCFLALVVLQPLTTVSWNELPDLLSGIGLSDSSLQEEAKQKNDAVLEALIQSQTERQIRAQMDTMGIRASFRVTLQFDDAIGAPVPWSIGIRSDCLESQRSSLSAFLERELGIPEDRQTWEYG